MTAQEIFDTAAKHLLKQNAHSRIVREDGTNSCLYRGPNGTMCAVGVLIKDEHLNLDDNRAAVTNSAIRHALQKSGVDAREHEDLLMALQHVHDEYDTHKWEGELVKVAVRHDLKVDVLKEFAS